MKRIAFVAIASLSFYLNVGGCLIDDSVTDFTFKLPQKNFSVDTGAYQPPTETSIPCVASPDSCLELSADLSCGTGGYCQVDDPAYVPEIPCSAGDDPCPSLGSEFSCDLTSQLCQARVSFELVSVTDLANEVPELETVGSYNFTTVRLDYIHMRVLENTFSVATPPVDVFVAPETTVTLYVSGSSPPTLSPGVEAVGRVPSIPAGVSGHIEEVQLTAGGSAAITNYCRTPQIPFNLFVASEIVVQGGDPIPQGKLVLQVDSAATVSLD